MYLIPYGIKIGMFIRVGTLLGEGKVKLAKTIRNYCIILNLILDSIYLTCLFLL